MKRAKIIVIEGTDGSGKETQSKKLEEYYLSQNLKVKRFSFPIYNSATGKIVGGPYLGKPEISDSYFEETSAGVDPLVSSLYFAADRRYNFLNSIESELYSNDIVILDRYITSNMGHQAGKAKNTKQLNKNAILIVEYAKANLENGMEPIEAALEASKLRLRPILMTSFAFILGCLPLAIATGPGAGARVSMGNAVVGGMTIATGFGIFLIPVLFVVVENIFRKRKEE